MALRPDGEGYDVYVFGEKHFVPTLELHARHQDYLQNISAQQQIQNAYAAQQCQWQQNAHATANSEIPAGIGISSANIFGGMLAPNASINTITYDTSSTITMPGMYYRPLPEVDESDVAWLKRRISEVVKASRIS